MSTAIVWFRRDLRLQSNPALQAASQAHQWVIPLFIHAPEEAATWSTGAAGQWWLHHSLAALDQALRQAGSRLILRHGASLSSLRHLIQASGAEAVYWNRLYEPALIARDRAIKAALQTLGIKAESYNSALLWEPWTVRTGQGQPYKVFTPYWKANASRVSVTASIPPTLPPLPPSPLESLPLSALELLPKIHWYAGLSRQWQPGEAGAQQRLQAFCHSALADYPQGRNRPDWDGVSRLSPHLHWGELAPQQIWQAVAAVYAGSPLAHNASESYLRELGWREFAHHVLFYEPQTPEHSLDQRFDDYPWQDDPQGLAAWQQGRTGIPLVDAGMRQLWHTGWMHNRVRMVVASFLSKNLRIHWLHGARWFWDTLVDADLANNTLGWQWTAGCGVDAAPYFRVFNPVRQAEQYDPEGTYIAEWVPELAALPARWRAQPWAAPAEILRQAEVILGQTYPHPLVDLKLSRAAALAGYQQIRA